MRNNQMDTNQTNGITPENPVHKVKVVPMSDARQLLKFIYHNLKQGIDQETLVDFKYDGISTDVAFVIGTREIKLNIVEGGQV